jgi:APA family basic amino acid/polyamine antiporter
VIIPLGGFFFFQKNHFVPFNPGHLELGTALNTACLMTFWGFIGLESATTTSSMIENPTKTIPRAVVIGTIIVAVIYFFNSLSVMGVVSPATLANSQAPYAEATRIMVGGGWDVAIALIAFAACIGTLNAWVLTSGQIAAEAAKDGLFPPLFAKVNRSGSPYASLLIAYGCTLPLLALTLTPNILTQLGEVIDLSVTTFLFIYLLCSVALIRLLHKDRDEKRALYIPIALAAAGFCGWALIFVSIYKWLLCSLFVLSGLPIYLWQSKKRVAFVRSP